MSELISDRDFTNQNFNYNDVSNFIRKEFPTCRYSAQDIKWITYWCYSQKINALVVLAKLQQEQGTLDLGNTNYYEFRYRTAMGARIFSYHTKKFRLKYYGFDKQIEWGCKILRWYFEDYEPGNEILLEDGDIRNKSHKELPQNAATYDSYVYCPSYSKGTGHPSNKGKEFTGNSVFSARFKEYKKRWVKRYGCF